MGKNELKFRRSVPEISLSAINERFGLNLTMEGMIYEKHDSIRDLFKMIGFSKKQSLNLLKKILRDKFSNLDYMFFKYSNVDFGMAYLLAEKEEKLCYTEKYINSLGGRQVVMTYYPLYLSMTENYINEIKKYILEYYIFNKKKLFNGESFYKELNYFDYYRLPSDFYLSKHSKSRSLGIYDIPLNDIHLIINGKINKKTTIKLPNVKIYTFSEISIYVETDLETDDLNMGKSILVPFEAIIQKDFSIVENKEIFYRSNGVAKFSKQMDMPIAKTKMWQILKHEFE